ncbi:MAG TPA: hypothetical protein DD381_08270 [Lentisphaeria bacterium]|nr:MAG: hypothetical protein A2X47_04830 [Lentisphaerae bacterium GWF2_38_69]HBM16317.1 hypothetical protein [Lentisphaeria bacterium]
MPSLTVRNIPDGLLDRIRILSIHERRSINNEVLAILEKGVESQIVTELNKPQSILSKSTQIDLWKDLCGKWTDDRKTDEIIEDIYNARTKGRDVNL